MKLTDIAMLPKNKQEQARLSLYQRAHKKAKEVQKLDKSDPFTYSRIFSHYLNGVIED